MYTGTKPKNWAFHFVGKTLRNGAPIPGDGEWLKEPHASMCHYGLHASYRVSDALQYAPGNTLCLVELDDIVETQSAYAAAAANAAAYAAAANAAAKRKENSERLHNAVMAKFIEMGALSA